MKVYGLGMLEAQDEIAPAAEGPSTKTRETLAKRLADIVCLPTSRISPQERHIAADLLIDVLKESEPPLRMRCAQRIAGLPEAPASVLRWLGVDDPAISEPINETSDALLDADVAAIARFGRREHRLQLARRRGVSSIVTEVLVEPEEADVILALLENRDAEFSDAAMDLVVRVSRDHRGLTPPASKRRELRPAQGLTLFWWASPETRKQLLLRFGVERSLLQEGAADVFAMAAAEGWSDPVTRKALQFIEPRQRNRQAVKRSPHESLEAAIDSLAAGHLDQAHVEEISYLAGLKPATGARILADSGGEPISVMCKGTGLKRGALEKLWRATRPAANADAGWEHVVDVYDCLATNRAQTVLRYWNWSLTSAMSPSLAGADRDAEHDSAISVTAAERASRLVWGAGITQR
ncbi:MAG: DUF2336 domain-containing protein [Maricaulaceae bacterium]